MVREATRTPAAQPAAEIAPSDTPAASPTPESKTPEAGATRISPVDHMEQVYVPAGEFTMGADDPDAKTTIEGGVAYPENPVHTVTLDGFWIDKYEVTTGQYAQCVAAGACEPPWSPGSEVVTRYYGEPEYSNYPVIWVNWYLAGTYCSWAGRRLPTEAEWEKAARGADARKYPWGNDPVTGERANYCDVDCPRSYADWSQNDGYPGPAPVGSYPAGASPYGAMDMAGNVWEWTSTLLKDYPYEATDGREDPTVDGHRVWRGGPYSNSWWWMRSSLRYHAVQWYRWFNLGFRCASSE
jgi:formylglycine-generating enzyme required for sulfatase activity